ncbi:MAG: DUF86 domain-containing protein [Clostridiales bacterium]|nr:DUF86 domain-containing protein [Clostridiales bacterium]
MDNIKNDRYYVDKILVDVRYLMGLSKKYTKEQILSDETVLDSIFFRFIQIAENSNKLTESFKNKNTEIAWSSISGLRNRIVHDYGHTDLNVILDTLQNDIPKLCVYLENVY